MDTAARAAGRKNFRHEFDTLLNSVGAAIISVDPAGRITEWNRAAEDLVGFTKDQVLLMVTRHF